MLKWRLSVPDCRRVSLWSFWRRRLWARVTCDLRRRGDERWALIWRRLPSTWKTTAICVCTVNSSQRWEHWWVFCSNNWCDIHFPFLLLFCTGFPKWLVRGQLSQIAWGGCGSCCRPPDRVRGHVLRRTEPRGGGLDDECRVSCSGWNPARNVLRCDWCSGAEQRACASRAFP